jgi:uncharacterized protein (TIGR02246 family)
VSRQPARIRLAAATLAYLVVAACGNDIVSPGVPPELKHSWEVAFNRGDLNGVVNLYSADAQLVLTGSAPIKGRDAIRTEVEKILKSGVKVHIGSEQNVGSGDLAYVYGEYSMLEHEGGKEVEQGAYVEVWRRRGSTWLIDLDVNTTVPVPAEPVTK